MKRFLKLYIIEQKLALRSADMLIFGVASNRDFYFLPLHFSLLFDFQMS